MKWNPIDRCEQCPEMNPSGNRGKNVTCNIANKIIPDIERIPKWCPLKDGVKGKLSYTKLEEI